MEFPQRCTDRDSPVAEQQETTISENRQDHHRAGMADHLMFEPHALAGESDEGVLAEHTYEMASLIPTAELTILPDTGHYAVWDKPEEFNETVLEFLGR